MTAPAIRALCASLAVLFCLTTAAGADLPYTQHENIVYGDVHGVALVMDIFTPNGNRNGVGIVDVASGAYHSDRGKIRDHKRAQMYDIFGEKGYTVFAVRPGSITKFNVPEMISHVNMGIRWVKEHAADYEIDPQRLGITGASAGGHLACLAAVTADDKTRVKAAGVFFPPTDLLKWGENELDIHSDNGIARRIRRLVPIDPADADNDGAIKEKLAKISPARQVTAEAPPFLLIHGDADFLVPLQQSQVMVAALKNAGVPAELIVKKGGGHPWLTIHEEVRVLADWFDKQLLTDEGNATTGE